ncbi:SPL family radical SAM protein [Breznakiella homolactica]|uniref:Radical SAM protein n=1 Tax=Breznakiella homolactica TaxID=2798577 RepID=A0A7T7XND1_9SPIR|nr:radical SAM protein [Breznakiella homolactica]QQO09526.1 radical SAM protein [Breznakiella homolactica]
MSYSLRYTVTMEYIPAKTIVTRTKSPGVWFGIEYNMNIYRGCSHGCIYCDSRSLCYGIENFDTVRAKQDALRIIRNDLAAKRKTGVVGTGAMSDPYNPFERELKLTRNALELINAYRFGAAIATKSPLVARDTDILKDIAEHSPVMVKMTVTAADDGLCRKIEPRVAPSSERFAAVKALTDAGVCAGILMMPILPFIEDTEDNILSIVRQAAESGARFIYPAIGMTLRAGNREYFYEQLDREFPGIREKYIRSYGDRYSCTSTKVRSLWKLFTAECQRFGIRYEMRDIIIDYKRGYTSKQLSLF